MTRCSLLTRKKWKRGDYRRAVGVATVPLAFCILRFSAFFLSFMRCLRHATLFVLFILLFLSNHRLQVVLYLLFGLEAALEINLSHLFSLISAIVVLVLVGQLIFVLAIIAQHTILDISADRISTAL